MAIKELMMLLGWLCGTVNGQSKGAMECPCLPSTSHKFAGLAAALASVGLPNGYGQEGCKAYDKSLFVEGFIECKIDDHEYCQKKWCYVDRDVCIENKTLCTASGGELGSQTHPSCRTRSFQAEDTPELSNKGLFFSYNTCGDFDKYSGHNKALLSGRVLQVSIQTSEMPPWNYPSNPFSVDEKRPYLKGYEGIMLDLVDDFTQQTTPNIIINLSTSWASAESRAKNPSSSFNACVMDTVLGNTDLCIGDFWVTSERLSWGAQFLSPSLYEDEMFLIAKRQDVVADGVGEILWKPFSPFSSALWYVIVPILL